MAASLIDKGHKLAAEGLSLFDAALDKLYRSNAHLEEHAAVAESAAASLSAEAEQARAKAEQNRGVISRLETLVHGEG